MSAENPEQMPKAKAAALSEIETRREQLELFQQIESTQSESNLFWSHVKNISGGLLSSVSPPPIATDDTGKVQTDPIEVLKVWRNFSIKIANPGPEEECIYDDEHKKEIEGILSDLRAKWEHQEHL